MISTLFILIWFMSAGFFFGLTSSELWLIPIWLIVGYALAWISMVLLLIIMMPYMKFTKVDNKFKHYYIRSIAKFLSVFVLRLDMKVEGKHLLPTEGSYVMYANHKSYADPFILYQLVDKPTGMAAKKGIYKLPIVRNYMPWFGCIRIDRENNRDAAKSILKGIEQIKQGMCMAIFPEGGIKDRNDEQMVAMRAGAYKLATKAEAPIVPITLIGTTDVKYRAPWRMTKIKVIIHEPIYKEHYQSLSTTELADHVMKLVNETIKTQTPLKNDQKSAGAQV